MTEPRDLHEFSCLGHPLAFLRFEPSCGNVLGPIPGSYERAGRARLAMMKPDISTLSQQLKQERLYVSSERQILQRLNADVLKTAERLYHTAWIGKQQRINLDRLILTSADASPTECCQRAKVLEDTQFVEGYRRLGSHEGMYGELVARLREAPRLVASCLVCGERLGLEGTTTVLQVVYTALYGNGITPQDEAYLLQVLRYLMEFSLKQSDSPRRLLRRATCSFSLLFRLLSDGLAAAKIFLTAALREPILRLLVEDQDRLETDPAKLLDRLEIHTQERLFGPRGTDEFRARVLEAVEVNVTRLVALVNRFASSLRRSTHCFPTVLRWVASQAYVTLARAEGLSPGEARAVCTDLLLACFICPALVNPEQYGVITDAPINEVARFNLMQVGQVLQQLAMLGCEDSDSRMKNIVSRFDRSCVSSFVDVIIGARVLESPPLSSYNLMEGLSRTTVFITAGQLQGMIGFLHAVLAANSLADDDRAWLESLLARLPSQPPLGAGGGTSSGGSSHALCSQGCTPSATPHVSPATTPSSKKNLLQIAAGRSLGRLSVAGGQQPQDCDGDAASGDGYPEEVPEEVLVLSLGASCSDVLPGFMSENEVLSLQVVGGSQGDGGGDEGKLEAEGKPDKTLRFSLCSDNLEGVSEAGLNSGVFACAYPDPSGPSNRSNSVSSLDLEAESVSELGAGASANSDAAALHLLEHEQATTQDNLDDKLRKFEIRDMMGLGDDRDISETVSETWSTDVVGSDFDPNPDEDRLQEIAGTAADSMLGNLLGLPGSGLLERCTGSAMSETTSEAWSVEVLASDSEVTELKQEERLQELESCSGLGSVSDDTDVREVSSRPSTPGLSVVSGISATSEDNPNKTEDLRSECDSDFGGKDSMTSPETEEAGRGPQQLTSSSSQIESILSIFDPLNLADGPPVVRPRIQVSRPEHPSPSEPFLADAAGNAGGGDGQPGHGGQHQTAPGGFCDAPSAAATSGGAAGAYGGFVPPPLPPLQPSQQVQQQQQQQQQQQPYQFTPSQVHFSPQLHGGSGQTQVHFQTQHNQQGDGDAAAAAQAAMAHPAAPSPPQHHHHHYQQQQQAAVVAAQRPFGWKSAFERPQTVRERFTQFVRPRSSEATGVTPGRDGYPRSTSLGAPLGQGLASAARRAPGGEDAVGPSLSWSRRPVNSEEGALHHAWTKRTTFAGDEAMLAASSSNWGIRRGGGGGGGGASGGGGREELGRELPLGSEARNSVAEPSGPGVGSASGSSSGSAGTGGHMAGLLPSESPHDDGGHFAAVSDQPDDRKDSDDEKSDKSKPWWKKKLSAIQKGPISFKKRDRQDREREDGIMENRFQAIPDEAMQALPVVGPQTFAADDILDKYRSAIKRASPSEEQHNEAAADGDIFQESPRDEGALSLSADDLPDSASQTALPRHSSFTFRDAKKKLRLALCSADIMAFPLLSAPAVRNGPFPAAEHLDPEDNEIVCFLKVQLAEAIHLQDKSQIAQLQETLRCVARFDNRTCRKLLAAIDDDYRRRAPYIAYLTRCRQGLQATQAHLERTLQRVQRDKDISTRYFTAVCVRLFLERREDRVLAFIDEFKGLTASDEKTAVVSDFLQSLYGAMAQDVIWQHASEEQLQDAQVAIERSIMSRIFRLAFYPNQDGDIMRDQLFHEHIQRLCRVVSANHRALLIPEVYLKEAPWPSAQAEVRTISAYKTPRDKVQCILRTCSTIMNLLSLANEDSVPGADDFVPVLVYVVIKANPPCMLSTVQYINNFYEKRLSGEEQYWWMQFTAAIEFIKTIDDRK
ncbi:GTPase-activating protein and VPS9 domain-containing protein 1 isoform X2 [Lampetra planeri]